MGPTCIFENRITLSSVISIAILAIFLMNISPTMYSAFANVNQPIFSVSPYQILTKNNSGIIILENATVIDGTGALPEPNTTIVINGSRIFSVASNTTANNFELHRSAAKNVIGATALGIENDVGTIEPGKQADIMVLSDIPMDDISNTKKIEAVINNGQFVNGYNCKDK